MPANSVDPEAPSRITARPISGKFAESPGLARQADSIFRRFFDLMARFERSGRELETKSAPTRRARITPLDNDTQRLP